MQSKILLKFGSFLNLVEKVDDKLACSLGANDSTIYKSWEPSENIQWLEWVLLIDEAFDQRLDDLADNLLSDLGILLRNTGYEISVDHDFVRQILNDIDESFHNNLLGINLVFGSIRTFSFQVGEVLLVHISPFITDTDQHDLYSKHENIKVRQYDWLELTFCW